MIARGRLSGEILTFPLAVFCAPEVLGSCDGLVVGVPAGLNGVVVDAGRGRLAGEILTFPSGVRALCWVEMGDRALGLVAGTVRDFAVVVGVVRDAGVRGVVFVGVGNGFDAGSGLVTARAVVGDVVFDTGFGASLTAVAEGFTAVFFSVLLVAGPDADIESLIPFP